MAEPTSSRYKALLEKIFFDRWTEGEDEVRFEREAINSTARELGVRAPSNVGDVIYSFRYRGARPDSIAATQPAEMEWIIEGVGRAKYAFRLVTINRIRPNENLLETKIPDATPEIVSRYALSDEQALLARVRYNRLIDIFLGLTTYSLQNHLRTTVAGVGQIEIDELYVGVDRNGCQFVVPVQAKGGSDELGVVQTKQDLACCAEKFPGLVCRAVSAQFMADEVIALFELSVDGDRVVIVDERHYRLVPADLIDPLDLKRYASRRRP